MKTLFLSVALFVPALGLAHGTETHDGKPKSPVVAEQQPFGRMGEAAQVKRVITVGMSDRMRYEPALIRVKVGETVRIVAQNHGAVLHEIVLGTKAALEEHAALMKKFPGMEHDEPHMAHVAAGQRGEIVWQFNRPGEFFYACLIPGHFEAGMVGRIVVEGAS